MLRSSLAKKIRPHMLAPKYLSIRVWGSRSQSSKRLTKYPQHLWCQHLNICMRQWLKPHLAVCMVLTCLHSSRTTRWTKLETSWWRLSNHRRIKILSRSVCKQSFVLVSYARALKISSSRSTWSMKILNLVTKSTSDLRLKAYPWKVPLLRQTLLAPRRVRVLKRQKGSCVKT